MAQLAAAIDDLLDDDPKSRRAPKDGPIVGLILRSAGRTFSAGADLKLVKELGDCNVSWSHNLYIVFQLIFFSASTNNAIYFCNVRY